MSDGIIVDPAAKNSMLNYFKNDVYGNAYKTAKSTISAMNAAGNKQFANMYASADASKQYQLDTLDTDLAGTLSEAYGSYLRQQNQIQSETTIAPETAAALIESNKDTLSEAYKAYMSNYNNARANIVNSAETTAKSIYSNQNDYLSYYNKIYENAEGDIDALVNESADYSMQLYNELYDYIDWALADNDPTQVNQWTQFYDKIDDKNYRLKSRDDFYTMLNTDDVNTRDTLYNQILNSFSTGGNAKSITKYLMDAEGLSATEVKDRQNLVNWLAKADETTGITNMDLFRKMFKSEKGTVTGVDKLKALNEDQVREYVYDKAGLSGKSTSVDKWKADYLSMLDTIKTDYGTDVYNKVNDNLEKAVRKNIKDMPASIVNDLNNGTFTMSKLFAALPIERFMTNNLIKALTDDVAFTLQSYLSK